MQTYESDDIHCSLLLIIEKVFLRPLQLLREIFSLFFEIWLLRHSGTMYCQRKRYVQSVKYLYCSIQSNVFFFETSHAFIHIDSKIKGISKPGGGPNNHTKRPAGKDEANLANR
jgi:hypothetical protein